MHLIHPATKLQGWILFHGNGGRLKRKIKHLKKQKLKPLFYNNLFGKNRFAPLDPDKIDT